MKKRVFTMLNFFAFNVLFFAIYLNFIHKDINNLPVVSNTAPTAVKTFAANDFKASVTLVTKTKKEARN